MLRSGWSFRLRAEVQQRCIKDGWHCGFITLTYNDENLPHIPQELFCDYEPDGEVFQGDNICNVPNTDEVLKSLSYVHTPCFDKSHARRLIRGIRKYLVKNFGCKDFVYFLACEYGSNTQRPHLHGLFCWPPIVPDFVFYGLIRDYWCGESNILKDDSQKRFKNLYQRNNLGFTCPRELAGYAAANEKPFVVSDPLAAANYCSKYACKDLYFERSLKGVNVDRKDNRLRDYLCFHLQNRSLGVSILNKLTDEEKLALYRDGFGFIGENQLSPIPIYIRNKLLFTPYYIVDGSGKRLVRRQATDFFKKNLNEIYTKKEDYYTRIFEECQKPDFFFKRFVPKSLALSLSAYNHSLFNDVVTPRQLARHYLNYYGLPYAKCYVDSPANLWAARFDEFGSTICPAAELVNPFYIGAFNDVVSVILGSLNFCITTKYTAQTELADKVKDFFSSSTNKLTQTRNTLCLDKYRSTSLHPLVAV